MRDFNVNTCRTIDGFIDVSIDVNFKNTDVINAHPMRKSELNIASQLISGVEFEDGNGIFDTHKMMSFSRNVGGSKRLYSVVFEEPIDWEADSEEIKRVIEGRIRTINKCIEYGNYDEVCRHNFCGCNIVRKERYEVTDTQITYVVECSEGHKYKTYEMR